jgi:hypothetical protein
VLGHGLGPLLLLGPLPKLVDFLIGTFPAPKLILSTLICWRRK